MMGKDGFVSDGGGWASSAFETWRFCGAVQRMRVLVAGTVQGVWFRESTRREAEAQGVAGWVRNLRDGRVEAVFEGEASAVQAMVEWCQHGPPNAKVENVQSWIEPPSNEFTGFTVLREERARGP